MKLSCPGRRQIRIRGSLSRRHQRKRVISEESPARPKLRRRAERPQKYGFSRANAERRISASRGGQESHGQPARLSRRFMRQLYFGNRPAFRKDWPFFRFFSSDLTRRPTGQLELAAICPRRPARNSMCAHSVRNPEYIKAEAGQAQQNSLAKIAHWFQQSSAPQLKPRG